MNIGGRGEKKNAIEGKKKEKFPGVVHPDRYLVHLDPKIRMLKIGLIRPDENLVRLYLQVRTLKMALVRPDISLLCSIFIPLK